MMALLACRAATWDEKEISTSGMVNGFQGGGMAISTLWETYKRLESPMPS